MNCFFLQGAGPDRDPFELFPFPRYGGKFSFNELKEPRNKEGSKDIFWCSIKKKANLEYCHLTAFLNFRIKEFSWTCLEFQIVVKDSREV